MSDATAYWVVRRGIGELRREPLPTDPPAGTTRMRAQFSAVSAGTERLVGLGRVPAELGTTMACRGMAGSFALPVKYGYSLVGVAETGPHAGHSVFTMHPHQDRADVPHDALLLLPPALPRARATLIPNLETALNAVWDADLAAPTDIAVFGGGAVGLLLCFTLHALHGVRPTLVEPLAARRALAARLPFVGATPEPGDVPAGHFALTFHTTGNPRGLQAALDALGFEGRVFELSWYGSQRVELDLGGRFHAQRQQIIASQVGAIARPRRATHGTRERLAEVLRLICAPNASALDALLGVPTPFAMLPARMATLYGGADAEIVPLVAYPDVVA